MKKLYNIVVEKGQDGYLISTVIELPGCHTQAKTMDELISRTEEAIHLFLDVNKPIQHLTKFIGLQQIEV